MDTKGIDLRGLFQAPSIPVRVEKREAPTVRPVERAREGALRALLESEKRPETLPQARPPTEEEAERAASILKEELSQVPEVEVDWAFKKEIGQLVVLVRDKETGRVLREIPPEMILKAFGGDISGLLVDKTA